MSDPAPSALPARPVSGESAAVPGGPAPSRPAPPEAPAAPWPQLAPALGAALEADAWGLQARFPAPDAARIAAGFAAPLTDLGLLSVTGAEARAFLHTQLTNDVEHLAQGEARWYGYCTAKGRLLSTFLGWPEDDGLALTVARPMAEALRKRLTMFVLRTKARVADVSEARLLFGLGGDAAAAALATLGFGRMPAPMACEQAADLSLIGLPEVRLADQALPRWLLRVPAARAAEVWQALSAALAPASSELWRWTEVCAGVPRIVAATSEQFVPQMLNLDVSGGVSFTKGCYPGQEVVARTHYLGKQRRRMFLGRLNGSPPEPGSDVLGPAGEPVGRVVLAASAPEGGTALLFEAQIAAVANGPLSAAGAPIALGTLPYALPE